MFGHFVFPCTVVFGGRRLVAVLILMLALRHVSGLTIEEKKILGNPVDEFNRTSLFGPNGSLIAPGFFSVLRPADPLSNQISFSLYLRSTDVSKI